MAEAAIRKPEPIASKVVKAGRRTYFVDLRESEKGNRYLRVTETRSTQEGRNERSSLLLFPDRVEEFQKALNEVAAEI